MNSGQGSSLGFSQKNAPAGVFPAGAADNGLSVDPITSHIVLGNDLGFLAPGQLLNDREIFMDSHELFLRQRNTSGFDDWGLTIFNNFMAMQDIITGGKVIYWTVDFAGNTGTVIGNDRTEPGAIPPFVIIRDTVTGLFGRLQFSFNDAMELTDATPSFALALFQNGDVAIQAAGAVDPGPKFFVTGRGSDGSEMRVEQAGNALFNINDSTHLYQLGDINAAFNGTMLNINDTTKDVSLGSTLGNRCSLSLSSSTGSANISFTGDKALLLDVGNGIYTLGDVDGAHTGTTIKIDDTIETAVIQNLISGDNVASFDLSLFQVLLGDVSGAVNNTLLDIDDSGQLVSLFAANGLKITGDTTMLHSGTSYADGAAAAVGTLLNAPAAGNPTKWIPIDDNGITRFIPAW